MKLLSRKKFIILLAAILLAVIYGALGSALYFSQQNKQKTAEDSPKELEISKKEEIIKPPDKSKQIFPKESATDGTAREETIKQEEIKFSGTILAGSASPLIDFNKSDYEAALRTNKLVALYFYASQCLVCDEELSPLYEVFNKLEGAATIGFRVNFNDENTDDDERNLAREFGVDAPNAKIFIKNGRRVLKSAESWDKNRYLEEINKYIQ